MKLIPTIAAIDAVNAINSVNKIKLGRLSLWIAANRS